MKGQPHSDETRAAVLAALLTGQSVNAVAAQFHLSKSTVIAWRREAGVERTAVQPQKKADIGALVIAYLDAGLAALAAQSRLFGDTSWLKSQSAADLAVLHGVLADKAFRIISALEAVPDDGEGTDGRPG